MSKTPVHFSQLNTEPLTVRCPACMHVGKSAMVMDTISDARAASNTLLGILGCLSCRCDYMLAPTYYFLVHYCSSCSIRLVSVPWDSDPIPQLHSSFLVPVDPARAPDGPKIAPSPFGPPPQKVDIATLRNCTERFADSSPSLVLEIKHKSSILTLPVAAINAAAENTGYEISWPGFPSHTHKGFASPIEYKPADPMSTVTSSEQSNSKTPATGPGTTSKSMSLAAWNPDDSTPHIRVSAFAASTATKEITNAVTGPELATAQVFPTSKDFILHTPRRQTPLVLEEDTPTSRYISHRSGLPGKPSPSAGFLVWRSSSWGPLTWTVRKIRVNDMKKPSRCLVLLDAYDRLVGVMGESKKEGVAAVRLSLYGPGDGMPQVLVAEILASFAALAYVVWNYEQLGVADPGLAGFVSGALDVAGAATGLAGV